MSGASLEIATHFDRIKAVGVLEFCEAMGSLFASRWLYAPAVGFVVDSETHGVTGDRGERLRFSGRVRNPPKSIEVNSNVGCGY